jgi:hypothetical protein
LENLRNNSKMNPNRYKNPIYIMSYSSSCPTISGEERFVLLGGQRLSVSPPY